MEKKYNRCDFCNQQQPDGECFWSLHSNREKYCEKAINKMIKVMIKLSKENFELNGDK